MMLARYDSSRTKHETGAVIATAPVPPAALIYQSRSIAGDSVSALGRARHLFGREPVAIDRAHIDEPRVVRGCVLRRMVADGCEAALHVDARRTRLEFSLERIDRDFRVRLRAIGIAHPRRVVDEQLSAAI